MPGPHDENDRSTDRIDAQLRAFYDDREMRTRADRPLGEGRESHLAAFVDACRRQGFASVLEVGCGAARDGVVIAGSGLHYTGVDLSAAAVDLCRERGLDARVASALDLPFGDSAFDAGWSMSTLMHLPGAGMATALSELRRVVRPGGIVEIGVWGADEHHERVHADGRYFHHRTDAELAALLGSFGEVTAFDTGDRLGDGSYYQWARVVVGPTPDVGGAG